MSRAASTASSSMQPTFGGKYTLEGEIGYGGCGTVFLGVHTIAGKEVAIKVEPLPPPSSLQSLPGPSREVAALNGKGKAKENMPMEESRMNTDARVQQIANLSTPLKLESKWYKTLCGAPGVPYILYSGRSGPYNVLVLDLMGPSLEDLFKMCNRHFTLKTVLMLADQLLTRIQTLHSRHLLHRDIKPANFVMGTEASGTSSLVNVIDFGLAKRFRDPMTNEHIPYMHDVDADGEGLHGVGTSLFAAINTHLGIESSRRDDLESLAYMLIYFLRGSLPWRRLKGSTVKETWDVIRDKKLETEALLTVGLPQEFDTLYRYARGLDFEDLPDYEGLKTMFRTLAESKGIQYDWVFDWTVGRPPNPHSPHAGSGHRKAGSAGSGGRRRACEACEARAVEERAVSRAKAERAAKRQVEAQRKAEAREAAEREDPRATMAGRGKPAIRRSETMPELRGAVAGAGAGGTRAAGHGHLHGQEWREGRESGKLMRGQGQGQRDARLLMAAEAEEGEGESLLEVDVSVALEDEY